MSLRTLIEINHDVAGREDTGLLVALARYVRSANREHAEALEQYGLRVIGMRHHSGNFIIEGDEPDGFPVKFMPRAPAATASPAAGIDREREAISPAFTEGVESRAALIDGIWDEAVDLLVVTGLGHLVGTSGASALIEGFADAVLLYQKGGER